MSAAKAAAASSLALLLSACSVIVAVDEGELEPCRDAPLDPLILFPLAGSGVLGEVPVRGSLWADCSGVDEAFVSVREVSSEDAPRTVVLPAAFDVDGRFEALWDTGEWGEDSLRVELSAWMRPNRSSQTPAVSKLLGLSIFSFSTIPTGAAAGWEVPSFFAKLDLDGITFPDAVLGWDLAVNSDGRRLSPQRRLTACAPDLEVPHPCVGEALEGQLLAAVPVAAGEGEPLVHLLARVDRDEGPSLVLLRHRRVSGISEWTLDRADELSDGRLLLPRLVAVALADVDVDGDLDYALLLDDGEGGGEVRLWEGPTWDASLESPPETDWMQLRPYRTASAPASATVGDFCRGDGFPDLVVSTRDGLELLCNTQGTDPFSTAGELLPLPSPGLGGRPVQLADYDRDGDLDLVVPFPPVALWRNEASAGLEAVFQDVTEEAGYEGGILADINNDGLLDAGVSLGTPEGRFLDTGLRVEGLPLLFGSSADRTLDLLRGLDVENVSLSTLDGSAELGRIVVTIERLDAPANAFGIGSRVRLVESGERPEAPSTRSRGTQTAEVGALWSGLSLGTSVSFGVDADRLYDVYVRAEPGRAEVLCAEVAPASLLTVTLDSAGDDCREE